MAVFYRLLEARGYDSGRELPTFHWVLLEIAVCLLVEEVAFYYSHRYLTPEGHMTSVTNVRTIYHRRKTRDRGLFGIREVTCAK